MNPNAPVTAAGEAEDVCDVVFDAVDESGGAFDLPGRRLRSSFDRAAEVVDRVEELFVVHSSMLLHRRGCLDSDSGPVSGRVLGCPPGFL